MRFTQSSRRYRMTAALLLVALASVGCMRSPEAKSAKFIEEGKKLLAKKDPARAILQFRNAVQATPKNAEAYYQLGLAYLAAGDLRNGVGSLRRALDLNPNYKAAQLRLADLMANASDPGVLKDAQKRLEALLQDAPENPDALHALALTELKLGKPEDAMQHLAQAAAAAPQELLIAVTMAQAKLQQKDAKGAEAVLAKAVESSPKSADAHSVLADFYVLQNRMPEAEAQLKLAREIDPMSGRVLMALARLQLSEGRSQEAEQSFKKLSEFKGYEPIYGTFLSEQGRHDEAIRQFEELARAHPENRQIRTSLVVAYRVANRLGDAKKVLSDALKKNPNDLEALLQRSEILVESGEYAQAQVDLNKVLKFGPDSAEVHYVVAKLNQTLGKTLIYRAELAKTLKLNQFLLEVRLESARDLIASNNPKAALDLLDEAPDFQRASTPVLITRNWALWALGDMPGMRKGIDSALALGKSPELLIQDGLWKLRSGQTSAARAALESSLNLNPSDLRALNALRESYSPKDAAIAFEKVKEYAARAPNSAPVQEFLGVLLMAHGDRAGARKAFEAAKIADPSFVDPDLSLVQVDVLDGKVDDARKRLQALLAADRGGSTAHLWLGTLEESKGNRDAAIEQFRKALKEEAENTEALNNLAYFLSESAGPTDEALRYAEKAVELAPANLDYTDTLGWILYRKGLYGEALPYLERAGKTNGRVVWKYHLAMAYAKADKAALGRMTLAEALRINPQLPEAKMAKELFSGVN